MAIYTYLCNKCNRKFDIIQGKEAVVCDVCQATDARRVFTLPMIKTSKEGGRSSCTSCTKTSCSSCR